LKEWDKWIDSFILTLLFKATFSLKCQCVRYYKSLVLILSANSRFLFCAAEMSLFCSWNGQTKKLKVLCSIWLDFLFERKFLINNKTRSCLRQHHVNLFIYTLLSTLSGGNVWSDSMQELKKNYRILSFFKQVTINLVLTLVGVLFLIMDTKAFSCFTMTRRN